MNRRQLFRLIPGALATLLVGLRRPWKKHPTMPARTNGHYFIGVDPASGPDCTIEAVWEDLGDGMWWLKGFKKVNR